MALVVAIPATIHIAASPDAHISVVSVRRAGPDHQNDDLTFTDQIIVFRCGETGRHFEMSLPFCWDHDAWLPDYAVFSRDFPLEHRSAAIVQLHTTLPHNDVAAVKPALN